MYCSTNWEYVSLSDPETVKALLMFRSELDPTYGIEDRSLLESGADLANINNNIHLTYIDLQKVMDKVKFTDRQKKYLYLLEQGYSTSEVADNFDITNPENAEIVINNICQKISDKNKELWGSWVKWDYKRVNTSYKQCSKCKKFKPMVYEYFRKRKGTKDGFMYICRECE